MSGEQDRTSELLGLVGYARAGKSEICKFLGDEYGYITVKPSAIIKESLVRRYGDRQFSRPEYRAMGEELRAEHGPGYYLNDIDYASSRVVVDGMRHFDTADNIRQRGGFLLGVVARLEERFQRAVSASDSKLAPSTIEEFASEEQPEMTGGPKQGGELVRILSSIDPYYIIDTSGMSVAEVQQRVIELLADRDIHPIAHNQH